MNQTFIFFVKYAIGCLVSLMILVRQGIQCKVRIELPRILVHTILQYLKIISSISSTRCSSQVYGCLTKQKIYGYRRHSPMLPVYFLHPEQQGADNIRKPLCCDFYKCKNSSLPNLCHAIVISVSIHRLIIWNDGKDI